MIPSDQMEGAAVLVDVQIERIEFNTACEGSKRFRVSIQRNHRIACLVVVLSRVTGFRERFFCLRLSFYRISIFLDSLPVKNVGGEKMFAVLCPAGGWIELK